MSEPNIAASSDSRFTSFPFVLLTLLFSLTVYRLWVIDASTLELHVDEAYYWLWAQQPAWGYYSKPPGIAFLIGFSTFWGGDSQLVVKGASALIYALSTLVVFLLAKRLHGPNTACWAAVLFATLPAVSLSALIISTDVLLILFWSLALLYYLKALESDNWFDWVMLGLVCGFGLLSKYTMVLFSLCVLVHLAVTGQWRYLISPKFWFAVSIAVLVFVPNVIWNIDNHFPTLTHTVEISGAAEKPVRVMKGVNFILEQAALLGPVIYIGVLAWFFRLTRRDQWPFHLAFTLPFLFVIAAFAMFGKANANWAAPIIVCATIACTHMWLSKGRYWISVALGLNLLLAIGLYHFDSWAPKVGAQFDLNYKDPFKRVRGWNEWALSVEGQRSSVPRDICYLSSSRSALSHLGWQLRNSYPCLVSWHPGPGIKSQFDLTSPLTDGQKGAFVLVERSGQHIADHFTDSKLLGEAVRPFPNSKGTAEGETWQVWLVDGFKGY
ncbi:glycosyltransferase family 39 protein [Parasalinivibrio latis]